MKNLIKLIALAAVLLPAAASAQQMLTLKGAPASADSRVTVGDVFDNAGPLAGVVLGYRSGATVILDAATVQSVVGANGGYWANPRGQHRILVTAAGAYSASSPAAAPSAAQRENPFAQAAPMPTAKSPFATTPIAAVPSPAMPRTYAASASRGPIVVHRQEAVDVTWSSGGISLTMSGIAQKDAAAGDTISIQIPTPKKAIDAVVTGPGRAIAGPGADQYLATLQLSSR